MNIAAMGNDIYARLCRVLELPELIEDERFLTVPLRARNRPALNAAIGARTATRPTAEWIALMNKEGVPCGPILGMDQTFEDPQVRHLGLSREIRHPALGPISVVGQPMILSRSTTGEMAPAPERGQHNGDVYGGMLGLAPADLQQLAREGVI
jgi:crotonobetainyl-CoA:carnitine CoA-transferase CaiB-like acyl-CoA transferase